MFQRRCVAALGLMLISAATGWGDIYRWDTGEVIAGTEGIVPGPENSLKRKHLEYADFIGVNLTDVRFREATLTEADFTGANLTDADFRQATLSQADFTDAMVIGTRFVDTTGFTPEQLYSTASYQQGDLSRISLGGMNLTGWDFAGKNLTDVDFRDATVTGADFTDAVVKGTSFSLTLGFTAEQLYSTASYQQGELSGIELGSNDLTGWNFAGKNLTNAFFSQFNGDIGLSFRGSNLSGADFAGANLTDAYFDGADVSEVNFTDAVVKGTWFGSRSGFTAEQLYSTASYQQGDLSGIGFSAPRGEGNHFNLTGWDFAGKNLTDAYFWRATLTGADFTGANLSNAGLGGDFTGADFKGADLRGAMWYGTTFVNDMVDSPNLIWPSGDVYGLDLTGEGTVLTVRDNEVPVSVSGNFLMNDESQLELVLSDEAWGSTIRLTEGFTPTLGGTLALTLSPAADLAQMAGQTFDLFDWSGLLEPTNMFSRIELPNGRWDVTQLYVTGEVVLTALPGDANGDLEFSQLDIIEVLAAGKYLNGQAAVWDEGDWNNDGLFNQLDIVAAQQVAVYLTGKYAGVQADAFVAVPEPASLLLLGLGVLALAVCRHRVAIAR